MPVESDADDEPTIDSMLREAATTFAVGLPSEFAGTDRFELVRRIGEGGFGVVYEAIDHVDGGRVALKVLRRPHAERLYWFKREFRGLTELVHPNLVRLHDLFTEGSDIFFTMELIEGVSLREHLATRPEDVLDVLRQLAEGLAGLHAAGKLHRDIKPSNILVERDGRVVLLDFGLAIEKGEHTSERAGTPAYMSPEQHRGEPLTEASDWYAFGIVLFELFTGARPRAAPERPSVLVEGVSLELDELCAALLERDPARRARGDDVLERLRGAPQPSTRTEHFVGRTAELAALAELFERTAAGQSVVAFARGPSGIGKTELLRRFVETVRQRHPDAMVLSGRCYERESVPYKALDAVIDEIATRLSRLPAVESASLLPRDAHALVQLFPVLRQVPGFRESRAPAHDLGGAEVRARGAVALRELFARMCDRWPVVVCVDDLQWGDIDSALLLADLLRAPDAPPVFWLATFREEEATTSPFLLRLQQLRHGALRDVPTHELQLTGLADADARALAATLLTTVDDSRAGAIAQESGGSPFFVHELARFRGAHPALADLVRHRLAPLEGAARRVLEVIAVSSLPLGLDVVAAASGADVRAALATLRAEHWIRLRDGAHKLVEVYHDRIREAVVSDLHAGPLRATHHRLATALEQCASDPAQIGSHFADGGEPERALGFLVRAAERAASALAHDDAARHYQRALALCTQLAAPIDTLALELACAQVLSNADRGLEAAQLWSNVLDRVDEPLRTELRRRVAEELLLRGRVDEGYAMLGTVLDDLGLAMPRTRGGAIVRIAWARLGAAMTPGHLRARREPPTERELQRVDTLEAFVWTTTLFDPLMAAALQAQHRARALDSGDAERAVRALSLDAALAALEGSHARSARSLVLARELAPKTPSATLYGLELAEGIVDLLEGRWPESLVRLAEVERNWFHVKDHSSIRGTAYLMQIMNLFWMGRSGDALRRLPPLIGYMERRGNANGWLWLSLLEAWALSCSGRLDEAWALNRHVEARLPARGFQVLRWFLEFGQVKFLLLANEGDAAWRRLEEAERRTRFVLIGPSQRISKTWVRASAALMRAVQQPAQRRAMLAEARRAQRRLAKERVGWVHAVIRLLDACIASVEGREADALRLLADAEPELDARHLEAALAAARVTRGSSIGGDLGADLVARGQAWMQEQMASPAIARALLPGAWSDPR